MREMVRAEDYLHSNAISMVNEAILKVKEEVKKRTLTDANSDGFYFLLYLLSRPELRYVIGFFSNAVELNYQNCIFQNG